MMYSSSNARRSGKLARIWSDSRTWSMLSRATFEKTVEACCTSLIAI
jgi:hypothetical protein